MCERAKEARGEVGPGRKWTWVGGWFNIGLYIIKPTPAFMVESHPPYLVYTHSSFLCPARHRVIKFGNFIPPCRSLAHTCVQRVRVCVSRTPARRFVLPARRPARLKPTTLYKRIKVSDGGALRAIPRKAHPATVSPSSLPRSRRVCTRFMHARPRRRAAPPPARTYLYAPLPRNADAKIVFLFTIPGESRYFERRGEYGASTPADEAPRRAPWTDRRINATHKRSL